MFNTEDITEFDEKLFLDIRFYLELYAKYVMTIRDARFDKNLESLSFKELFSRHVFPKFEYIKNQNPDSIFISMISVFNLISGFYMLSLANDEMLKKIDDKYLKKIENILNNIFIDKSYANQFNNRQKIAYIRNAISHTENGKLYKILPKGNIEIKLDAVPSCDKTLKPFHIIINSRDLHMIADHLFNGVYEFFIQSADFFRENLFYKSQTEIKNIINNAHYYKGYTRFDTKKEIVEKIRRSLHPHPDTYTEADQLRDFRELVYNGIVDNKIFKYDDNQVEAFLSCVTRIQNLGLKESDNVDPFDIVVRMSNHSMYPNPAIHLQEMRFLYDYTNKELRNPNNSSLILFKKKIKDVEEDPNSYMTDKDIYFLFPDFYCMSAIALYYYYVFGHMNTSRKVEELQGKTYDLEKIRNSFIHGTWFSYYNRTGIREFYRDFRFALYDCNNGQKNEGNWNWKSPIMTFSEINSLSTYIANIKIDEYNNKYYKK